MQNETLFWIWMAEALGVPNRETRYLLDLYENPYNVFCAESAELERLERLPERAVLALSDKRLERASQILDACERLGIGIVTYSSELYPAMLREIPNPPTILYYVGKFPCFEKRLALGMVGTRKMSAYGMETAYRISYELSAANVVIVSGMAAGIDGVCAAAALKAGGYTVAVLGCGLDVVYPRNHGKLMSMIAQEGLLLSEYPPGEKPIYFHFPARNRIISGLSHGTVVVEAGIGSGSLITAKEAVQQGRDVFAIPTGAQGTVTDGAAGLLRDGAIFATESEDIAARYQYLFTEEFRVDLLKAAKGYSHVDTDYLSSIGVIERKRQRQTAEARQTQEATVAEGKARTAKKRNPCAGDRPAREHENRQSARFEQGKEQSDDRSRSETADAILQSLDPVQRAVIQAIPDDASVSVDELTNLGYAYGEIITALTMLEISGLVQKLPGSLYTKA